MSSEVGFRPNTTVSIYRDDPDHELMNEFGDPVENNTTPVKTGVPIAITHRNTRQFRHDERRTTTVQRVTGRLRASSGVEPLDRLKDERTGQIYLVEEIVAPLGALGSAAIRVELTLPKDKTDSP